MGHDSAHVTLRGDCGRWWLFGSLTEGNLFVFLVFLFFVRREWKHLPLPPGRSALKKRRTSRLIVNHFGLGFYRTPTFIVNAPGEDRAGFERLLKGRHRKECLQVRGRE